uniref:Cytochrome c biogenesis protein Ccs1 n=1 Tax=Corynoplastis japonica TaxID=700918 RepID=A0A1X9PU47_9RHOD|nr:cytochrome c biogenesis protein ccs1 [Corynoplastis japonica]
MKPKFYTFKLWILKLFSNLNFSISLLLLIACLSTFGTFIEQDQTLQFYQQSYTDSSPLLGIVSWKLIINLGLDHIYNTTWFFSLLFIFGMSLLSCTFSRQLPILKVARKWQFYQKENQFQKLQLNFQISNQSLSSLKSLLIDGNYYVFQRKNYGYAYKGLIGRVSPIIVHISIIIMLLGAVFGKTQGFVAQEFIPKGETFHIQNILNSGSLSYIPQNITGRIRSFFITYNNDNSINQFFSDILLLNDSNQELDNKEIFVNKPLRFQHVMIYQTDWDIIGIRLQAANEDIIQMASNSFFVDNNQFWITTLINPNNANQSFSLLVSDLSGQIYLLNADGKLHQILHINEYSAYYNRIFKVIDIISRTGVQIKSDPGIPFVYFGFFLIMFSTLVSYISYSQIWFLQVDDILYFGGMTNRALLSFEKEFFQVLKYCSKL